MRHALHRTWSFLALLSLGAVAACGAEVLEAMAVIDTLPGGIERVTNPIDAPAEWRLELHHTLGTVPGMELSNPTEVVADSRGLVYVLDRQPAAIRVYAPDGTELSPIAREGSGPGEIRDGGMLFISRDTLVHQDPRQSRAQAFTVGGELIAIWTSVCCWRTRVAADRDGRFPVPGEDYPATAAEPGMFAGSGFVRYLADGTISDTIPFPRAPEMPVWRGEDANGSFGWSIPFQPNVEWTFSRAGRLFWGNQASDRLVESRTGRDTVRVIDTPSRPPIIPDSIRQAEVDVMIAAREAIRASANLDDVPTTYPRWSTLLTDDGNRLWVSRPGPAGPGDHFDVLGADGVLVARVPNPFGETERLFITERLLYVIEADPTAGIDVVNVYEIVRE